MKLLFKSSIYITSLSDCESEVTRINGNLLPDPYRIHHTSQRIPPVGSDHKNMTKSTSPQTDSRATPVSLTSSNSSRATPVSLTSSTSSRSTIMRSEVATPPESEKTRSEVSGKSDHSDRESAGSRGKSSSPFMYGKSKKAGCTTAGYAQLGVGSPGTPLGLGVGSQSTQVRASVGSPSTPGRARTCDLEHAQDIIRKNTQEIRRLGFGRSSYQPQQTSPKEVTSPRASFDERGLKTPNSSRKLKYDQSK